MQPLVTALLPTIRRERTDVRRALPCILSQNWQCLEVLILDDLNRPSLESAPQLPNIRYQRVDEKYLGSKLNLACSLAKGEYLVHFYDDDYSGPFRITDQVTRLEESGKAVTIYRNLLFADAGRIWKQTNWPGGFGMSLCYRRDWALKHPFPNRPPEDWPFVAEAMERKQFIAGDAGDHMMVSLNRESAVIGQGWIELS